MAGVALAAPLELAWGDPWAVEAPNENVTVVRQPLRLQLQRLQQACRRCRRLLAACQQCQEQLLPCLVEAMLRLLPPSCRAQR